MCFTWHLFVNIFMTVLLFEPRVVTDDEFVFNGFMLFCDKNSRGNIFNTNICK